MKNIYILCLLFVCSFWAQGQINISDEGTVNSCSNTFVDSGGIAGNYSDHETYTITICPDTPGSYVSLDFTTFDVEAFFFDFAIFDNVGATLYIYDGIANTGTNKIGEYDNDTLPTNICGESIITSSVSSGCLTLTFESYNSNTGGAGWEAIVSCSQYPGGDPGPSAPDNFTCSGALPFCADTALEFPNVTAADCVAPLSIEIEENTCLRESPNPVWYFIEVDDPGVIEVEISQTTGVGGTGTPLDVDFAVWGPFPDRNSMCPDFTTGSCSIDPSTGVSDHNCTGTVIDCSYSHLAVETATIPNALSGEFYMFVITNFDGGAGYITLAQTGGTGTTDCTIVCPQVTGADPTCGASNGTITIDQLDPSTSYTVTYDLDGNPAAPVNATSNPSGELVITGLDAGVYDNILINFPGCEANASAVTLTSSATSDASFTMTPTCDGGTATITGDTGGSFAFNPVPTDNAVIDATTGTVTSGASGTTYTIEYSIGGTCPANSTQNVTASASDDASFTMSSTCDGGTVTITGTTGGVFSFNPVPTDSAVIDVATGTITSGTPGATYTVEYTTVGACPSSSTQNVTVITVADASFTMTPTCDGGTAMITGTSGGNFTFNTPPTDSAVIDMVTGEITGGTLGEAYTVEYTITGTCAASSTATVIALTADASFNINTISCTYADVTITGTLGGTFTFNPLPTDAATIDPTTGEVTSATPNTMYTVEYVVCTDVVSNSFTTIEGCVIPNGISPNNDGVNDNFDISFLLADKLSVFNRYGNKVYELNNYRDEWYGKTNKSSLGASAGQELPVGTYYYIIEFADKAPLKGWIYINREN